MNLISAITSQIVEARKSCSLGLVIHMNGPMASVIADELLHCEDQQKAAQAIQMFESHSNILHVDDKNPWLLALAR